MAKRSKAKKRRRVEHTLELIKRHESEEDQVIRALGETNTARDRLAQRTRRDWQPRIRFWDIPGGIARFDPQLFLTVAQADAFKREYLGNWASITILDEPEGRDNGGDDAGSVSALLQPRYTWSKDGDAEGP